MSTSRFLRKTASWTVARRAMYSAPMVEMAVEACRFEHHEMGPLASMKT
jgi:hypothetical protein